MIRPLKASKASFGNKLYQFAPLHIADDEHLQVCPLCLRVCACKTKSVCACLRVMWKSVPLCHGARVCVCVCVCICICECLTVCASINDYDSIPFSRRVAFYRALRRWKQSVVSTTKRSARGNV